jgi:hypothetical protein
MGKSEEASFHNKQKVIDNRKEWDRPEKFVASEMNNLSNRGTNITTGAIHHVASGEL